MSISSGSRVSILVGGRLDDETRRRARSRLRPRIDVLELEEALRARVYDLRTVESVRPPVLARLPFLGALNGGSLRLVRAVLDQIKNGDAVYATGEDLGFPLAALLRMRGLRGPRLVMRLEDPLHGSNALRTGIYDAWRRYALPRIDSILCRTTAHLQYLNSREGVPLERLELVREPVDLEFFHPEAPVSPFPLPDDRTPYVLSAGLERRDYDTLIEAVRDLPLQVVIAAGSPWSHDRFDPAGSKVPPNVLMRSFSPDEMRDLYRRAAFVVVPVHPTMRACGMNVILEGWGMGKAVIATRTAGLLDYIVDGETGLFVPPADPEALREKILSLLSCPEEAARLGANGQRAAQSGDSLDGYVSRVATIIRSSMGDSVCARR